MQPNNKLEEVRAKFAAFTENLLRGYIDKLKANSPGSAHFKEFSDPVCSTIYLTAFEVAIVDSPLFQRLRTLKQLGVVHWVYPGATHTRFEHSLGVLHHMQELITSINRQIEINADAASHKIDKKSTAWLRLAALCHDLGHGVMSHVSENALRTLPEIDYVKTEFLDAHPPLDKVQMSEIYAYYIIDSVAFRDLISSAQTYSGDSDLPHDAVDKVMASIIGEMVHPQIPLMQELISGPFDADKLDYMRRDPLMAGVPNVTDIPRLIRKLRAVLVPKDELPEQIARVVDGRQKFYVLYGVATSGARTLDELLLGRLLLFDKIYRHQKVRALEGMVALLLRRVASVYQEAAYMLPFEFSDEELTRADGTISSSSKFGADKTHNLQIRAEIAELCGRLSNRQLFVRAFAFAGKLPGEEQHDQEYYRANFDRLRQETSPEHRFTFADKIAVEALSIIRELKEETILGGVTIDPTLRSCIIVDPPSSATHADTIPRACLISEDKRVRLFKEGAPQMSSWPDAYVFAKDIGYIYCVPELKPYVYLASEIVIRRDFGLRTPGSISDYVKADHLTENKKLTLASRGYYKLLPTDLHPRAPRLEKVDVTSTIEAMLQRFQGYAGPVQSSANHAIGESFLHQASVEAWLQQFESDDSIDEALKVIANLRLISRKDMVTALKEFLDLNKQFEGCVVAPLGDIKDSGPSVAYFAGDLKEVEVFSLVDALRTNKPIVLFDDFVGSGKQVETILCQLFGEETEVDLGESTRQTLTEHERKELRERGFAIVYAAGFKEGIDRLAEVGFRLKTTITPYRKIHAENLPCVNSIGLSKEFIEQCGQIGRQILLDPGKGHNEEWLGKRSPLGLGYGDKGLLVSFPYNTPAHSLACLWKSGTVSGRPWDALVPRRKKK